MSQIHDDTINRRDHLRSLFQEHVGAMFVYEEPYGYVQGFCRELRTRGAFPWIIYLVGMLGRDKLYFPSWARNGSFINI